MSTCGKGGQSRQASNLCAEMPSQRVCPDVISDAFTESLSRRDPIRPLAPTGTTCSARNSLLSSGRLAVTTSHLSVRNWDIFAGGISQAFIGDGGFATMAMRIREFASILTFRRTPQISARRFYGVGLRFLFAPELLGCSSGCS